ncbi:MAG: VOC family protein [Bdellovibrionales bacterium]|nr:VOC family protein [Bdellovibrionales bacterium]
MKLGYTLFYVDDVAAALSFYEKAFGLKTAFLHESGQYGELETGETKLGFVHHETAESHGFEYERSSAQKKPAACEIGLVTKDVAGAFDRAIAAGAASVSKPKEKPWGQVVSYVRDPNGFLVEICSPMG